MFYYLINLPFLKPQPCQHGGRCIDQLGGFECVCDGTGYSGYLCENNIDECASSPCENEARCEDQINDYFCHCYPGYEGKLNLNSFSFSLHIFLSIFPLQII